MPLNPQEEAKFRKLKKDCLRLGVPAPPEIFINCEVVDRNGVLILQDRQRGHSWTRNWYNALLSGCTGVAATAETFGAGNISGRQTSGTVRGATNYGAGCYGHSTNWNADGHNYRAAAASSNNGIVVGTNDGAFSPEAYQLGALIAHGTGSGQMSYGAQGLPTADYDATVDSEAWTITHTRILNNNSGAAIVVAEVGLIWGAGFSSRAARWINVSNQYLDERSVLNPTVNVPNGAQLTVTYEIVMDFSAID